MPNDISLQVGVFGAQDFLGLSRRLKAAGHDNLRKELHRGINRATKPMKAVVKAGIPRYMPSGYAPVLGKALTLSTSVRPSGVRITGRAKGKQKRRAIPKIDAGVLRHPVFGRRLDPWVDQRVRPGFFFEPLSNNAPVVRAEILRVMRDVADKITRGG